MAKRKQAFCIMSGGMDSTLAAHTIKFKYNNIEAIFFNWGQNANKEELEAINAISKKIGIKTITKFDIPINKWDVSSLTQGKKKPFANNNIIVSERNLVFLSIAASYARTKGGGDLIVGFNKNDAGYDTTAGFVKDLNKIFKKGNSDLANLKSSAIGQTLIKVRAPLLKSDKASIAYELTKAKLINLTYSCYNAGGPCGSCPACNKRNKATGKIKTS